MIEKSKSVLLFLLVVISLVQSYFLAYSKPFMEAKVRTELDYVKTEPLGEEMQVEKLIFPEQLVLHLGDDKHTVFYPSTQPYYELILTKLQKREFRGMQRASINTVDWDQIRQENQGVELRFGRAVPFELLQRVFKIDPDFLFFGDSIDRIWIYTSKIRDEVRTFFFSSDGQYVYESQRADLTIGDVEGYVGFGQYWDTYKTVDGNLYIPEKPMSRILKMEVTFDRYTTEQMQDNLFFDPGIVRTIQDSKSGPQFYADSKSGLKIDQNGLWLTYTDAVAPVEGDNELIDNVLAAINFVNQHGGWDGKHQFVQEAESDSGSAIIRFQQYYREVPIVSERATNFGFIQLALQQGLVSSYERTLVVLGNEVTNKSSRQLPGGDELRTILSNMENMNGRSIEALFPAYRSVLKKDTIELSPVWAARLTGGEVVIVANSRPL